MISKSNDIYVWIHDFDEAPTLKDPAYAIQALMAPTYKYKKQKNVAPWVGIIQVGMLCPTAA